MSSTPTPTSGSCPRTVHVTVNRCTNISNDLLAGCIETTQGYFVKVTIGKVTHRTADRQVDEESHTITWDEDFTFNNTTSSSLLLRVYRRRTLRTSKLIEKINVGIHNTSAFPSALPRAVTFEAGPRLEFSFKVGGVDSAGDVPRQNADASAVNSNVGSHDNTGQVTSTPTHEEVVALEEAEGEDNAKAEEALAKARRALESQGTPADIVKRVLEGIEGFSGVVDVIAEVHPFAQIACAIFRAITDPLISQLDRDEQIRALLNSFANFCDAIDLCKVSDLGKNKTLRDVLKRAGVQLTEVAYFVQEYCRDGSFVKRALKGAVSGVDEMIEEYRTKLQELKEEFNLKLSIDTAGTAARTEVKVVLILARVDEIAQLAYLDDLKYVDGVGWNTDKMCLAGTRTAIVDDIIHWASFDGPRVLLLCGGAGSGKSSIAHTIAVHFKEMGRLGSIFCFSRTEQASRKPTSLFPHIARDLADLHPNIRAELCKAIVNKADRTASGITTQFEKLVLSPVEAVRAHLHGPIIIIIDALDEAGAIEDRRTLLDVLASRLGELPPNFRVLITTRPERDIEQKFSNEANISIKKMEDIPLETTSQDIAWFVEHQFAKDPEIGPEIRQDLVSKAENLFQWAFVACQYVLGRERGEPAWVRYMSVSPPQHSSIPSPNPNSTDSSEDGRLNQLYRTVLSDALLSKHQVPLHIFKFVMSWVMSAFEPLSCKSLNRLIAASTSAPSGCEVERVLASLGLLLSGVDDHDAPIAPLHISFRDFLTDFTRSREFFVDLSDPTIHPKMAWASFSIMREGLKFNICQLPTSYLSNKDVRNLEELIKNHISAHLAYACRFWTSHLCLVSSTTHDWRPLTAEVADLIGHRALYWMEILSLVGASEAGLRELRRLYSWMKMAKNVEQDILNLVQDLESFWSYFAKCISSSAPHIYVSALPFTPKNSMVAKNYTSPRDKTLSIPIGQLNQYPSCLNVLQGHSGSVHSVALSPDGTRIASGSGDNTIRIWNTENGELILGPLNGHTEFVRSVAFSPDGTRIISGSDDKTIRIWDAENGKMLLGPMRGHTNAVSSVAFSPDGSRIISGSNDMTIRIWNSVDGQMIPGPLQGHANAVVSVAFSVDGNRIISGSFDKTIRVWNAENGDEVIGPIRGHTRGVFSVAFSPNSAHIVSGSSDGTVRIWNAKNGKMALGPLTGHTNTVYSVAFSPDGTRIISGSLDNTIRIWSTENGQMILGPLHGHTDYINSVAFSPNGTRIISGSKDQTIRIWNPENDETKVGAMNGHNGAVQSVALSPDGTRITSCSEDRTIRIWDATSGAMVLGPLVGHNGYVSSVAFSPDGHRLVSGSGDRTICVWNAENGQLVLGPLRGHTYTVWRVCFSPDGSRIVSGGWDRTIRLWNSENGQLVLPPLYHQIAAVWSVAFSPNGTRIASGASDSTIRVWNVDNGQIVLGPLTGHTNTVTSINFSPDGSCIVSGSHDNTIRVWSAETGQMLLGPLKGHSADVRSVCFSPDGARIISGSFDKTIRIWNAATGEMVLGPLSGHPGWVRSAVISPDGTRVISGSDDSTIRVWNIQATPPPDPDTKAVTIGAPNASSLWHCNIENNWRIEDDWVVDVDGNLLFYVPSVHQPGLYTPRTIFCIGPSPTHLDVTRFVHGTGWEESFSCHSTSL